MMNLSIELIFQQPIHLQLMVELLHMSGLVQLIMHCKRLEMVQQQQQQQQQQQLIGSILVRRESRHFN